MDWAIRAATEADIDPMREVELDAGNRFRDIGLDEIADGDAPAPDSLRAYVDAATAWVAVDADGKVIAYASASVVDGDGHLDQVSVVAAAAGHGIGRALIDQVHDWARAQGHDAVTLTTFRDVAWNGPYYRRLGYVEVAAETMGPELAAIRETEVALGLDVEPRVAMRREI